MQQKTETVTPATLIVVGGNKASRSMRKLQQLLGGSEAVDIYFDGVPRGLHKKSKVRFLKNSLLRYIIIPLWLCFSIGKYSRLICYFSRSGYLLGLRNLLTPKSRRSRMIWIGFAPTPEVRGPLGQVKKLIIYGALLGFDQVICHAKPLLESLRHSYPRAKDRFVYVRWERAAALPEYDDGVKITDEGYIFCGGRTNRDFETVIEAVRTLNVVTKLGMSSQVKLSCDVPENVEIYRDIPSHQFHELMGGASIVVVALLKPEVASGQLVLRKAQLLRKAVVVTDIAGIDDYVSDGYDGLLVKPRDPVDLREKLALLLSTPDLRHRLAEAGYTTASNSASGDHFAEELAQVIGQPAINKHP